MMKELMRPHVFLLLLVLVPLVLFSQTREIVPGENLVTEGIPPIPSTLAESAQRYSEFRGAGFLSWHPAKLEMLITTRFADVPQVHWVKTPRGARTQMTFFPDRVTRASFNPKRPDYFLFSKDIGGGEWYQIHRCDVRSGDITLLTDGKSRNILGPWSNAGDHIVYGSTKRNGKDVDLYIMDPLKPESERMLAQLEHGDAWTALDWSPDDTRILAREEYSANESHLWLFDASSGHKTELTPESGTLQVSYTFALFSKDGKGVYTTTDKENEFLRLAYIDLASGKMTYLTSDIPWNVQDFDLSHDGKYIAFVTNEDGIFRLYVYDIASRARKQVQDVPVGIVGSLAWHNDNIHLAFTITSARSSTDVHVLDTRKGTIDRWTYSETGGLNVDNFPEPELVRWKSFDGKLISAFLYRPPARFTGKRPVIVNIHGGPESQALPTFLARNNYYLNELGIAMIFPNVRGSSGYGKTFLKLDNGFSREDSYKDMESCLDWIKTKSDLDGDRIMVTGGSYGGHSTLAVISRYSSKIRCAVDIVGMSNLVTFLEHTEAYRRDLRRVEYGDERDPKMRAFLEQIAPLNNAKNITKPLFIVQGKNDPRVPASEAQQMLSTLKGNKVPTWFLMANDEGHGFAKKKNADYQFYATILFIKTFLLN
jgi:dipeptidyl aminopeptidase/acylaminoacyl peptidase